MGSPKLGSPKMGSPKMGGRIGLTGGIASGKSSVSEVLVSLGYPVVDADQVAHELMEPGQINFNRILAAFGPDVLDARGRIDRVLLGQRVFSQPEQLQRLNQLVHPPIWEEIQRRVEELEVSHPRVFVAVPLLFENQRQGWFDEVWLVAVSLEVQKARLMSRNGWSEAEASARIGSQMPLSQKVLLADRVLENNGTPEQLRQLVVRTVAAQ